MSDAQKIFEVVENKSVNAKLVKRLVYAKPQKALVINEPGLYEAAKLEVERLLSCPLQPFDDAPQLSNSEDGIALSYLSFRRLLELVQRLQTAADFFWILAEKRVASPAELRKALAAVAWDLVLPQGAAVRVHADSRGSRLYHEGLMRETAEAVLAERGFSPQRDNGVRVRLLLRENRLIIGMALFEEPLYKRGNKAELKATAPLKETLAAGLIQSTAAWLTAHGRAFPSEVYVPFAGSGTLGLEALAFHGGFSWQAFFQTPAVATAPCYPRESAAFLLRRLTELAKGAAPLTVRFLDHHEEMVGILEKTIAKISPFLSPEVSVTCQQGDFFAQPLPDAFLPLHPPYGERLGVTDIAAFYGRIAAKLDEARNVAGFILVPEEAAWSAFLKKLRGFTHETSHVTQGGKDVRVVRFFRDNR